jgi:hypothetical protein
MNGADSMILADYGNKTIGHCPVQCPSTGSAFIMYVATEWPLSHDSCQQPLTYVKPEVAITVFELLMMSGVSLETC